MSEHPDPPPEGVLIQTALERMRPKLSVRAAAPRAGIGEARWRQIVKGYVTVSGTDVPVAGPAETVARMAQVVGVTPDELAAAGREDAAEELRLAAAAEAQQPSAALGPTDESLDELVRVAKERKARGDDALYRLLESVWRLENPRIQGLTESDSDDDTASGTA